jgi:hypothetical protein
MLNQLPLGGELSRFIVNLVDAKVDFVVCGGVACILQGVERSTFDIDISVALTEQNLRPLLDVVRLMDLQSRIPEPLESLLDPERRRAWIHEKNAKVISLRSLSSALQVDVFLQYPVPYDELSRRADASQLQGRRFRFSSKRDLLRAKLAIEEPRKHDRRDIEDLRELLDDHA